MLAFFYRENQQIRLFVTAVGVISVVAIVNVAAVDFVLYNIS